MGRRQCQLKGCTKLAAVTRGTPHCIAHGGGKRCQEEDCIKSALGDTEHCVAHGGGNGAKRTASSPLEAIRLL
jgi:hypothetical protein